MHNVSNSNANPRPSAITLTLPLTQLFLLCIKRWLPRDQHFTALGKPCYAPLVYDTRSIYLLPGTMDHISVDFLSYWKHVVVPHFALLLSVVLAYGTCSGVVGLLNFHAATGTAIGQGGDVARRGAGSVGHGYLVSYLRGWCRVSSARP